jgi:hypothetical protein
MSPLALFYDQLINTITPVKKQQQINIHPWSFFWEKNTKFHTFADKSLKPLPKGFLIRWMWWFSIRFYHF